MKKAFILLLVFITSFQLSGGYALIATLTLTTSIKPSGAVPGETEVSEKKADILQYLSQLLEQKEEEKEKAHYLLNLLGFKPSFYEDLPVFSIQSKHFLVHYATAIKGKLPAPYLLLQIFRL